MTKRDTQHPVDDDLIGLDGELRRPVNVPLPGDRPGTYTDKKQDRFRPRSPELHFTTSLYIDRAVALLPEQTKKVNDRQDLCVVQCTVTNVDSDRVRFKLESQRMGKPSGRLEGTMQRWQGSLTRVDVGVQHLTYNDYESLTGSLVGAVLVMGVGAAFLVQLFCIQTLGVSPEKSVPALVVLTSVLALLAVAVFHHIIQILYPKMRITQVMAQRDVSELITILTGVFGEHDLQWLDQ